MKTDARGATPEQRDEWKRLAEAATPGPWEPITDDHGKWGLHYSVWAETPQRYAAEITPDVATAEFIAASRSFVPELLAEVKRLQAGTVEYAVQYDYTPGDTGLMPQRTRIDAEEKAAAWHQLNARVVQHTVGPWQPIADDDSELNAVPRPCALCGFRSVTPPDTTCGNCA